MATVNRSALVPYSAKQMFTLVDTISEYAEFLPWCRSSTEHHRKENEVEASVEIAKATVNKSFRTINKLHPYDTIEMTLVDGPFKYLHGYWKFNELKPNACKISLDLEYEFSNTLISLAISPVFDQIANTLVDSFVTRAKHVYG